MTNTPISRIPLDGFTEQQLIDSESSDAPSIAVALTTLTLHETSDEHLSIALDWAMQLRERTGNDWATCIDVAMTLYFG